MTLSPLTLEAYGVQILQEIGTHRGLDGTPLPLDLTLEPCKDPLHGDFSTNAALMLSKAFKTAPHALAQDLAAALRRHGDVERVDIAGPGFVNVVCRPSYWWGCLRQLLAQGARYGESTLGAGQKINLEYVSANPTGPLHVGHGRVAVVADVIANLLEKVGFMVTREFYINDTGGQIQVLARSTWLRYKQALGENVHIPPDCYPGEYLKDVAQALIADEGDSLLGLSDPCALDRVGPFATQFLMDDIRTDLEALGIHHDVFISEKALHAQGLVDQVIGTLKETGLAQEGVLERPKGKGSESWAPQPLLLLRAQEFGEHGDRPLTKTSGEWTYLAGDIAYHQDKVRRGFDHLINVWGADHASHVGPVKASLKGLSPDVSLEVILTQIVHFVKDGAPLRISKRAGTFVTVRDVLDQLDPGVLRFLMIARKHDSQFTLDLDQALEQSKDNPFFYVQYAHARGCSVVRAAEQMFGQMFRQVFGHPSFSQDAGLENIEQIDFTRLQDEAELFLIKGLADWPRQVAKAAQSREPHRIATYLYDIAHRFHGLWNKGKQETTLRFLVPDDPQLSLARVALITGMIGVIGSGLRVLGVTPLTEM